MFDITGVKTVRAKASVSEVLTVSWQ